MRSKTILVAAAFLALNVRIPFAFAAEDAKPAPRPATTEELQKQVDDLKAQNTALTQQVQYWQGVTNTMQTDRNSALDAKADLGGKANIKPPSAPPANK